MAGGDAKKAFHGQDSLAAKMTYLEMTLVSSHMAVALCTKLQILNFIHTWTLRVQVSKGWRVSMLLASGHLVFIQPVPVLL